MKTSDRDLFDRWRTGDVDGFQALVRRHFASAWAVALSIVGDRDEAEDVCQDALVRCWERGDQCRDPDRFRGWLAAITRSVALNHVKRALARRTDALPPAGASRPAPACLAGHVPLAAPDPPPVQGRVSSTGRLWVLRSLPVDSPPTFDIFDRSGARVATVVLPAGRRVIGFGVGTLYATVADESDLLTLERYRDPG